MSYILDALKKSDLQRKQGEVPTLQTVHLPVRPQDKTPRVLYGVIGLLLLLLMFVLGYLFSQQFFQSQSVSSIELSPATGEKSGEPAEQLASVQSEEVAGQNADREASRATVIERQSSVNTAGLSDEVVAPKNSTEKPAAVATTPAGDQPGEAGLMDIPYLTELPDYQQQSIPAMEFAGHVYSSDASSRSVIINGRFMEEGDNLLPGLRIERITINGVVFAYQDTLFRVDILQDWSFE